jgi:hypothetical protein
MKKLVHVQERDKEQAQNSEGLKAPQAKDHT